MKDGVFSIDERAVCAIVFLRTFVYKCVILLSLRRWFRRQLRRRTFGTVKKKKKT